MDYIDFMRCITECTGRDTWDIRLEVSPRTQVDHTLWNAYYDDLISVLGELLSKEEDSSDE